MSSITYTARRSIQAGHTIGTDYSFDFSASKIDRISKRNSVTSTSISGKTQHVINHREVMYDVSSDYYISGSADFLDWLEFLESVDELETFTFDETGTIASPVNPITVELMGGYQRERLAQMNTYKFSFKAREVL